MMGIEGLKQEKRIGTWLLYNRGEEIEFAECSCCGYEYTPSCRGQGVRGYPLVCPNCRETVLYVETVTGERSEGEA